MKLMWVFAILSTALAGCTDVTPEVSMLRHPTAAVSEPKPLKGSYIKTDLSSAAQLTSSHYKADVVVSKGDNSHTRATSNRYKLFSDYQQ